MITYTTKDLLAVFKWIQNFGNLTRTNLWLTAHGVPYTALKEWISFPFSMINGRLASWETGMTGWWFGRCMELFYYL